MGNVGYRFLISFFGLTLTIIVIVNLLLFSGYGGFGDIQSNGDVYFGYSAFMKSFKLLETMMNDYSLNGFFSMSSFDTASRGLLNALAGGVPRFIDKWVSGQEIAQFTESLPTMPTFTNNMNLAEFYHTFLDMFIWFLKFVYSLGLFMVQWSDFWVAFISMIFTPLHIIVYALWIAGFTIYWVVIIFAWIIMLFRGYITSPMPTSNSQWSSIVEEWENQWSWMLQVRFLKAPLICAPVWGV